MPSRQITSHCLSVVDKFCRHVDHYQSHNHGDCIECYGVPEELLWYELSLSFLCWPSKFFGLLPSIAAQYCRQLQLHICKLKQKKFVLSFFFTPLLTLCVQGVYLQGKGRGECSFHQMPILNKFALQDRLWKPLMCHFLIIFIGRKLVQIIVVDVGLQ